MARPIPLTADPANPQSPAGAIPVDLFGVEGGGGGGAELDTGWRDVTAYIKGDGAATSLLLVRRVGPWVTVAGRVDGGPVGGNGSYWRIPEGAGVTASPPLDGYLIPLPPSRNPEGDAIKSPVGLTLIFIYSYTWPEEAVWPSGLGPDDLDWDDPNTWPDGFDLDDPEGSTVWFDETVRPGNDLFVPAGETWDAGGSWLTDELFPDEQDWPGVAWQAE